MGYASFKTSVPFNLCKKAIDRGGLQEEPEVTGDPSYDGNGEITLLGVFSGIIAWKVILWKKKQYKK